MELYCGIRQHANACYAYPSNLEQQKFLVTSVGAHLNVTNAVNKPVNKSIRPVAKFSAL